MIRGDTHIGRSDITQPLILPLPVWGSAHNDRSAAYVRPGAPPTNTLHSCTAFYFSDWLLYGAGPSCFHALHPVHAERSAMWCHRVTEQHNPTIVLSHPLHQQVCICQILISPNVQIHVQINLYHDIIINCTWKFNSNYQWIAIKWSIHSNQIITGIVYLLQKFEEELHSPPVSRSSMMAADLFQDLMFDQPGEMMLFIHLSQQMLELYTELRTQCEQAGKNTLALVHTDVMREMHFVWESLNRISKVV